MQQLAHVIVNGETIKVLARLVKMRKSDGFYVAMKLRNSGELGKEMTSEAEYLKAEPQKLQELLSGKVIKV